MSSPLAFSNASDLQNKEMVELNFCVWHITCVVSSSNVKQLFNSSEYGNSRLTKKFSPFV